jgi:uncharacterized delta-60 repeat protein
LVAALLRCVPFLAAVCLPVGAATLGEALNATNLTWTTGGSAAWVVEATDTHDGVLAVQSGAITHSQETWIETTVAGPGSISFWWSVSSESGSDYLEFLTNGVLASRISGEVGWQTQSHTLGAGNQVLRWRYSKDSIGSSGQDKGWVDQVSMLLPVGPPVISLQPASRTNEAGTTATFSSAASGALPLIYQWLKDGVPLVNGGNLSGAGTAVLTLNNVWSADSGGYRVVVTNSLGSVTSAVARLTVSLATVDSGFNPGADNSVSSLAVQADGKILVGGSFVTLVGQPRNCLGRLNADGTLDNGFNPGANNTVASLAVQVDGKILVGGEFILLGGQPRYNLARLNADGTLDSGFDPGPDGSVYSMAVQADGKILVGGWFPTLGGQPRNSIGRLNNSAPATQSLSFDGATATWRRGGSSPEVWRTTFEAATNATNWAGLGSGNRIAGGWQLTHVSVPVHATLRARGYVAGGDSGWFVESLLQLAPPSPPVILRGDGAFGVKSNQFGFRVSGSPGQVIVVEGSTNLSRWLPLQTNTLGASPVYFGDPGWSQNPQRFYRARVQ